MKHKLLLVDDSALARRSMRAILEAAGFEVVEAEDGMAALERYFVEKPDLRHARPGHEGDVRPRRADQAARSSTRRRASIVVSADVQELVAGDGRGRPGASGFVTKPVDTRRECSK